MPAAVTFDRRLSFGAASELLHRHNLQPYAVHMRVAGLSSSPAVDPAEASPAALDRAREYAFQLVLRTLCDRESIAARFAGGMRPGGDSIIYIQQLRSMATQLALSRRAMFELHSDSPVIHGVKVVGSIPALRQARQDPRIASIEPGIRLPIRGEVRTIVPDPPNTEESLKPETLPEIEQLTPAEIERRLERHLSEYPEECVSWSQRQEDPRRQEIRRPG
jgi:hypothetical protein